MRTVYATTKPGFYDTHAIAKGKWLQQLRNPSSTSAGLVAEPDNTQVRFNDTRVRTTQKILKALQ